MLRPDPGLRHSPVSPTDSPRTFPPAPRRPPSSPGGQRTATRTPFPAATSLRLRRPQPPLLPSLSPLHPPPPPPPPPPPCPRPPPRPRPPRPLIFVVRTQTTQHITKAGTATSAILLSHPAGQLGRSPLGHLLLKIPPNAFHLPTPPTCPRSPAGPPTRTTGHRPQRLRHRSLPNLVEAAALGGSALKEKKLGPPPAQPHLPVPAPQPQRPPMRVCPLLSTAAWIPALRCC